MRLRPVLVGLCATALTASVVAQAPSSPAFEVASVKPNTSNSSSSGTHNMPGGRVEVTNKALRDLIRTAFGSDDLEVVGGPDWVDTARWDIIAAPPPDQARAPYPPMLKALLRDRFKLDTHVEPRTRPIYKLVATRSDKRLGSALHASLCKDEQTDCSATSGNTSGIKKGTIDARGQTMVQLGVTLSRYAQRRVFDETGIVGRFDYHIEWSEDVSIFTAVNEQLGLKLEAAEGPVDVVVVDHVERPSED